MGKRDPKHTHKNHYAAQSRAAGKLARANATPLEPRFGLGSSYSSGSRVLFGSSDSNSSEDSSGALIRLAQDGNTRLAGFLESYRRAGYRRKELTFSEYLVSMGIPLEEQVALKRQL